MGLFVIGTISAKNAEQFARAEAAFKVFSRHAYPKNKSSLHVKFEPNIVGYTISAVDELTTSTLSDVDIVAMVNPYYGGRQAPEDFTIPKFFCTQWFPDTGDFWVQVDNYSFIIKTKKEDK
jgi:hypothetical protein